MHLILFVLLAICVTALVGVVIYAFWRLRRHLRAARRSPPASVPAERTRRD